MRFLKSIMAATLIAASIAAWPAQTTPTASAQPVPPAEALNVEGLLAKFGDAVAKVKDVYHTHQEIQPPDPAWGARSQASLWLKTEGVDYFFNEDGKVSSIRVDEPFAGKINGIRIGDSLAQMCNAFGPPDRSYRPFQNPRWTDYVYGLGDVTVEFQLDNDVVTTAWLRDKKSESLQGDGTRPFRRPRESRINCGSPGRNLPRSRRHP